MELSYRKNDKTVEINESAPLPTQAPGALVDVNDAVAADVALAIPAASGRRLLGYVAEETAAVAAAAEVRLRSGGVAGPLLAIVKLAADGTASAWWGPNGIAVDDGVSIDLVAGTVSINLFYS